MPCGIRNKSDVAAYARGRLSDEDDARRDRHWEPLTLPKAPLVSPVKALRDCADASSSSRLLGCMLAEAQAAPCRW